MKTDESFLNGRQGSETYDSILIEFRHENLKLVLDKRSTYNVHVVRELN